MVDQMIIFIENYIVKLFSLIFSKWCSSGGWVITESAAPENVDQPSPLKKRKMQDTALLEIGNFFHY